MASSSTKNGGNQNVSGPRYTREDLPNLPRGIVKMRSPDDLDKLFDKDGYLSPDVAGGMEAGLVTKTCFVCCEPCTNYCAKCKSVLYCSRECQKSHWKAHKAICVVLKDPSPENVRRLIDANPTSRIALQDRLSTEMSAQGREFPNVLALMENWLQDKPEFCPYGGTIETGSLGGSHMFALMRSEGRLTVIREMWSKYGRPWRPQDQKVPSPQEQADATKYIASELTRLTVGNRTECRLLMAAKFWTAVPGEITEESRKGEGYTVIRRGAEIMLLKDLRTMRVVQLQPDILKHSDTFAPSANEPQDMKKLYRW